MFRLTSDERVIIVLRVEDSLSDDEPSFAGAGSTFRPAVERWRGTASAPKDDNFLPKTNPSRRSLPCR